MIIKRCATFSEKKDKKSYRTEAGLVIGATSLGAGYGAGKANRKANEKYLGKLNKLSKAVEKEGKEAIQKSEEAFKNFQTAVEKAKESQNTYKTNPTKENFKKSCQSAVDATKAAKHSKAVDKLGVKRMENSKKATESFARRSDKVVKKATIKGGLKGAAIGAGIAGSAIGAKKLYDYKKTKK